MCFFISVFDVWLFRLTPNIIHPIGTVAKVEEIRKSGSKGFVLVVRGMVRFRADRYTQESPFFKAAITELPDDGKEGNGNAFGWPMR